MRQATRRLLLWFGVLLITLSPHGARAQTLSPRPQTSRSAKKRVSGSLVYWDQDRGFHAILAHPDALTEISPFWYHVTGDGDVLPYATAAGTTYEDPVILDFLRSHDIRIIPTIANIEDGVWQGAQVNALLQNPSRLAAHIDALVDLAVQKHYDGIDIDYEDLAAAQRTAFSRFIQQLADALHAHGKVLTVNVYGKTTEPGTWSGAQAQDWKALGAAADEVRLMTYEYHWAMSAPGPIAPIAWVQQALAFARTVIPAEKVMHGVPFYGYDWTGKNGTARVWEEAVAVIQQQRATANWDAASATPWFEYTAKGQHHTVWFENVLSVEAKLEAATAEDVGGVMLWRLAGEDPAIWPAIRTYAGKPAPVVATD